MSISTDQKSLRFQEKAGEALHASRELALTVNAEKQAALKQAAPLPDAMQETQLLEATEIPLLQEKLATHDGTMSVLCQMVKHFGKMKKAYAQKLAVAQAGGVPTGENGQNKAASAETGTRQHYVGQRAGLGEKRASDLAFRRLAGLPE